MNFILIKIKFIKFKPKIKFEKFERHNYRYAIIYSTITAKHTVVTQYTK